ncbi:hypothetical protein D3C72_1744380 [compost metagenome]
MSTMRVADASSTPPLAGTMAVRAVSIFAATVLSTACCNARRTDASCCCDSLRDAFSWPVATLAANACQVITGMSTPSLPTVASRVRTRSRCRLSQAEGDRPSASLQAASIAATDWSKPRAIHSVRSRAL